MKFYLINFNVMTLSMQAEVIEANAKDNGVYEELSNILESASIEFIDYNDEIVMIIDENGKYKEYNPVFQLKTSDGITLELAGKVLFARNIENEFSTDIGSIKYDDIFYLRSNLEIKLIGMIKPN